MDKHNFFGYLANEIDTNESGTRIIYEMENKILDKIEKFATDVLKVENFKFEDMIKEFEQGETTFTFECGIGTLLEDQLLGGNGSGAMSKTFELFLDYDIEKTKENLERLNNAISLYNKEIIRNYPNIEEFEGYNNTIDKDDIILTLALTQFEMELFEEALRNSEYNDYDGVYKFPNKLDEKELEKIIKVTMEDYNIPEKAKYTFENKIKEFYNHLEDISTDKENNELIIPKNKVFNYESYLDDTLYEAKVAFNKIITPVEKDKETSLYTNKIKLEMLNSICHELWSEDGYYKPAETSIKEDFKNEDFEYNVKIIFDDDVLNENVIDKIYKELTEELETFIKFDENGEEYIKKVDVDMMKEKIENSINKQKEEKQVEKEKNNFEKE
jgi:putative tetratricopeptide repeat-containing protein